MQRRHKESISYYKHKLEVDFYIPEKELLIQASYSIADVETRERECKAMAAALNEFGLKQGLIVTFDEDDELEYKGFKIIFEPAWK